MTRRSRVLLALLWLLGGVVNVHDEDDGVEEDERLW